MYLVFDFLKNGLSGVVSYNHLYFSPPLSNFKGGSFEPFEPPLLRACYTHTTKVQDIIVPCYFTYKQQNLVRNSIMKKVYVGDTLNMAKNQNNFIAQKTDRMLPFFISWTSMQFALRIKMRASTCTA